VTAPPAAGAVDGIRMAHPLALLGIGVLVTAIALPESWRGWPYAPFPVLHAVLAIVVPLWCRAGPTGRPWPDIRAHLPAQGRPFVAAVAFVGCFVVGYWAFLAGLGKLRDPGWNLIVTYQNLGELFFARYDRPTVLIVSYVLLGLWPMVGEELLYRGLLLRGLLDHLAPPAAMIVTSALFGLRHAAQLAYSLPAYSLAAGAAYFGWAFGVSMILCWVYVRTRSLWLCIAAHGVNVVLAPLALAILAG